MLVILQTDITDYVERGNITSIENFRFWKWNLDFLENDRVMITKHELSEPFMKDSALHAQRWEERKPHQQRRIQGGYGGSAPSLEK